MHVWLIVFFTIYKFNLLKSFYFPFLSQSSLLFLVWCLILNTVAFIKIQDVKIFFCSIFQTSNKVADIFSLFRCNCGFRISSSIILDCIFLYLPLKCCMFWSVCLIQILKHEWPARWRSFIPDLVSAAKTSETICENCMAILKVSL